MYLQRSINIISLILTSLEEQKTSNSYLLSSLINLKYLSPKLENGYLNCKMIKLIT